MLQQHVINDLGSTALHLDFCVEPGAVIAAFGATLGRKTTRTRQVTTRTADIKAVTYIGAVRQTQTVVGVHTTCTVPVQPKHTDMQTVLIRAYELKQ